MMSQLSGQIGPYEIIREIGRGGMGVVYQARDPKLDRDVAIKVLPDSMARDQERVARFVREAKLLASLNHTNIAQIYGFEEVDDKKFLVLEYVEGETLAAQIKRSTLSVDDALDVCKQIAQALEAAHDKGVIHRDLKPANVMIRPDGTVKVLDFGLAKAMAEESSGSIPADSPTITANFTRPGVILGTAAYMSPEQARGRPLDKRTDIWSFGCVLFECLGGARPFEGETATDLIAKILERDPQWDQLPEGTPPTVKLLLRRCFAKDRNRRLQAIADARVQLEDAIADPTGSSLTLAELVRAERGPPVVRPGSKRVTLVLLGMVIGALCVYLATVVPRSFVERSLRAPIRFAFAVTEPDRGEEKKQLSPVRIAVAPDGSSMVIQVAGADQPLYVREMDTLTVRPLPGTEGASAPFLSPDGLTIRIH